LFLFGRKNRIMKADPPVGFSQAVRKAYAAVVNPVIEAQHPGLKVEFPHLYSPTPAGPYFVTDMKKELVDRRGHGDMTLKHASTLPGCIGIVSSMTIGETHSGPQFFATQITEPNPTPTSTIDVYIRHPHADATLDVREPGATGVFSAKIPLGKGGQFSSPEEITVAGKEVGDRVTGFLQQPNPNTNPFNRLGRP
jgi:hypothetical protein